VSPGFFVLARNRNLWPHLNHKCAHPGPSRDASQPNSAGKEPALPVVDLTNDDDDVDVGAKPLSLPAGSATPAVDLSQQISSRNEKHAAIYQARVNPDADCLVVGESAGKSLAPVPRNNMSSALERVAFWQGRSQDRVAWHGRSQRLDEELEPTKEEDDESNVVCFGNVELKVVGIQQYDGVVSKREQLRLVREPLNPYDRNAIRVDNQSREQVGHVSRQQASVLAPLLDRGF
jgi:hypothetical protein